MPDITSKATLIRLPAVLQRTGLCKAWIYKLMAADKFPQSVKIGSRSIAFVESEVDAWVANKIAESRTGEVV